MPFLSEVHKPTRQAKYQHLPKKQKFVKPEGKQHKNLYGRDWQKLRSRHLAKYPLCVECGINTQKHRNANVDHIIPHKSDMKLFKDPKNLQTLCHSCHSRKTAKHDGGFGNRRKRHD
jgi:5-methylcytosine-specific restriction protein A